MTDGPRLVDENTEQGETITPDLVVYITEEGYSVETTIENPVHLAAVAWYLDQMARRGLAAMIAQQAVMEQRQPGLFVPEGFTQDHKKGKLS